MKVEFSDCRTSFEHALKAKEDADGETRHMKCTITADVSVPVEFLNGYLDGHLSGAQPADVFWRLSTPGDAESARYPRYMAIKGMELEVSKDRRYAFKFRSPPPQGWDGEPREFPGYREFAFMGVQIKKVKLTLTANGALVRFIFVLDRLPTEAVRDVAEMALLEEVLADGWNLQGDMVDAANAAAEDDEEGDTGDDDSDGGDDADDDETAPE